MKRILTLTLFTFLSVLCCDSFMSPLLGGGWGRSYAENYPYRSDFLWVTEPDHADWLYKVGEDPKISVSLYKYGVPQNATIEWEIGPDMLDATSKGSVQMKNGHVVIPMGKRKTPGFQDLRLKTTIDGLKTEHHIKVGFSVDKIEPFTKEPSDFQEFWDKQLAELKKFPLKYTKEPAHEYDTDKADCYLIKLDVDRYHCIYAYLFMPKSCMGKENTGVSPSLSPEGEAFVEGQNAAGERGSFPVCLCPPGAGVKTIKEPLRHRYYADNGCIRMEMEIHGLDPRFSEQQFKEISNAFNSGTTGYFQQGIDNRDNYYMKHVYLAMVRAIDFLTSLPEWDGKNVAVQGGSQGGALSLIAAGLDKRVTLCCANHPALTDMAGYSEKGRTGGYPHLQRGGFLTEQNMKTLQYYDVINFARHITCPVRMTWGYNDCTCPPTTSYACWNVLTCPKESLLTPINEHWTSEATEKAHCDWILKNFK